MNYQEHYDRLVSRARERKLDCYTESHHIIPRCMNGTNDKDNLVDLTAREHFIAHLLLMKIYPKSYGLIKAVHMMCFHNTHDRSMNRMYGWLKEKYSLSQQGCGNSQHNTCWVSHVELKVCFKIKKDNIYEYMLEGFIKKRITDFDLFLLPKQTKIQYCKCGCGNIIENGKKYYSEEHYPNNKKQLLTKEEKWERIKAGKLKNMVELIPSQKGEKNSQSGTKFMYNIESQEEKRIKKELIETYQDRGWVIGQLPLYCEICGCKITKIRATTHKCKIL